MSHTRYEPIFDQATAPARSDEDISALDTSQAPPDSKGKWPAIIGLCLCSIGVLTDGSVITVGIPSISADIGLMKHLGWSSSAFLLMACVGQPIFGRLYSLGLRRNPLVCGVIFYHMGTTLCGLSPSLAVFLFGRAISGVGAASLYVGTSAVVVSLVPAKDVALCLSTFGAVSFLCGVALPVICGAVIDHYSWRAIFFLSLPLSILGLASLALAFGTERVDHTQYVRWRALIKVDFTGTALLLIAFVCLLAPIGPESGMWAIVRLLGFSVSMFGFGSFQYLCSSSASFAPEIFSNRRVWLSGIVVCLLEMAIFTCVLEAPPIMNLAKSTRYRHLFYLALFYQAVKNFTAKAMGLQETMYMATMASSSLASGAAVRYFGRPLLWLGIGTAVSATAATLLIGLTPHSSMHSWLPFTLGSALGAGACLQLPFVIVASLFEGNERIMGSV